MSLDKGNGTVNPIPYDGGTEGVDVNLYSFIYLGARWGGWSKGPPRHFTPDNKTRYPLYRMLGAPQNFSGRLRKIFPHGYSIPRPSSPLVSRYTVSAVPYTPSRSSRNLKMGAPSSPITPVTTFQHTPIHTPESSPKPQL